MRTLWAALVLLGAGCTVPDPGASAAVKSIPTMGAAGVTSTAISKSASPGVDACQVTRPVPRQAIPDAAAGPIMNGSSHPEIASANLSMYGNDAMWVTVPRDGTGERSFRVFTVRLVEGALSATGRRLDAAAPPADFFIPQGYGPVGLQVVGITFPTAGCWEITQRLGNDELRFILWIVE